MPSNAHVLLIDDEPDILDLIELALIKDNLTCHKALTLKDARNLLAKPIHFGFCLCDLRLPDGNGLDFIPEIQTSHPLLPVAVITAHGSMETAIEAMRLGAFDFLSKPLDNTAVRKLIRQGLIPPPSIEEQSPHRLLGHSPEIAHTRRMIEKFSHSQAPVFIQGESGTGKELAANSIHALSSRSKGPFIAVNCGAIPTELMESEFFGHQKGAFSGAIQNKKGFFEAANKGTLFLDEIGDLPMDMQVKLLRAIQEKKVRPIGATQEIDVDVRIISATHCDIEDMVKAQTFRVDLFFRINVLRIQMPSLKSRLSDLEELAQHLLKNIALQYGQSKPFILDKPALSKLQQYDFPGNVRELSNILERAAAYSTGALIDASSIAIALDASHIEQHEPTLDAPIEIPTPSSLNTRPEDIPLEDWLATIERKALEDALNQHQWNRTQTAKALGLTLRQLRYKLTKHQID